MGRPGPRGPSRAVLRTFWRHIHAGGSVADAAAVVGVSVKTGWVWFTHAGGVSPDLAEPTGRYLRPEERDYLEQCWLDPTITQAQIARDLGRHPSTISRELRRNQRLGYPHRPALGDGARRRPGPRPGTGRGQNQPRHLRLRYQAAHAQHHADTRAARPKPTKLIERPDLRAEVEQRLRQRWSPEQIAATLRRDFPDRPEMQVSHETIYQALYVQGRGELRRELHRCLRTGRALRRPHRRPDSRRGRITDMVMISDRPAEAADRAVPGHWEGDLIIGRNQASAIGTLVERSTRYVLLLHLPARRDAAAVRDAMITAMTALPAGLRRSLTWDQGVEMARHTEISLALDLPVYFCDPHSPWQRGSNENTNGLLRQYFPKSSDLSVHTPTDLAAVAEQLNNRPRKTLNWHSPAQALQQLLSDPSTSNVASTG